MSGKKLRWLTCGSIACVCIGSIGIADSDEVEDVLELAPFTVTGTRIQGIDLETTVPIEMLSIQDLEITGYSQLGDALRDLPITAGKSFNGIDEGTQYVQGVSSVNLRGMEAELVLIDGLRIPAHDGSGGLVNPYNLNIIPSSAIMGVEILKDGASAIYGSDAISGVINIKTIRNFKGTEVSFDMGKTEGTHSWEYQMELRHGQKLGDKSNIAVSLDVFDRNNLNMGEHPFMESTNYLDHGGYNLSSRSTYPGNFIILDPTHPWFSPSGTHVTYPAPTDNPGLDDLEIFPSGMMAYFSDGGFNYSPWSDYRADEQKVGTYMHFDTALTDTVSAFADLSYRYTWYRLGFPPTPYRSDGERVLPAQNPYNPFGVSRGDGGEPMDLIYFSGRIMDAGQRIFETDTSCPRIVAGLEGSMFASWRWKVAGIWSESRTESKSWNMFGSELFQDGLNGVDLNGNGSIERQEYFNPFGPNDSTLVDYMKVHTQKDGDFGLSMLDGHASGTILEQEDFILKGSFGAEVRSESLGFKSDKQEVLGAVPISDIEGSRDLAAAYGELHLSYREILNLQLAGRVENYSDFGTVKTPKASASLRVIPELLIRGSYGEGFTAPSLPHLYIPKYIIWSADDQLFDPKRNEPVLYRTVARGGNPDLESSTSVNITGGFVLEPAARVNKPGMFSNMFKGLTMGIDYYDIEYENLIGTADLQWLLDHEDELASLYPGQDISIERGPPLEDEPFGPVTRINAYYLNMHHFRLKEYDMWLDWPIALGDFGNLSIGADCTYTDSHNVNGEELIGEIGTRYRITGNITWSNGNWSTSWFFRYIDEIEAIPAENYPGIASDFRINAQASYSGLWNTKMTIGVRNLENKDPSWNIYSGSGFHPWFPSEKRFWYVRVKKSW